MSQELLKTPHGEVPFILKRSSRRRTIVIYVDEKAEVSVYAPTWASEKEVFGFIRQKSSWIWAKLKEAQANIQYVNQKGFSSGDEFLFLGKKYPLSVDRADVKRSRMDFDSGGWRCIIPKGLPDADEQKEVRDRLIKWYRKQATEILGGRIFHYARLIGVEPKKIAIRTQKRMWGCCDYRTQTVHLNWHIILSPMDVVDYVVVHELCHLIVPDHSKRFWGKVRKFMPDFEDAKKWLKVNFYDLVIPENA